MSDLVGNPEDRFSHNEAHNGVFLMIIQRYFLSVFFKNLVDAQSMPRQGDTKMYIVGALLIAHTDPATSWQLILLQLPGDC